MKILKQTFILMTIAAREDREVNKYILKKSRKITGEATVLSAKLTKLSQPLIEFRFKQCDSNDKKVS